jgi:threonyl-tRNA synthetase
VSNISIKIKGIGQHDFKYGITPLEVMSETKGISSDSIICKVDGVLTDLSVSLSSNCELQFMDAKSKDGHSVLLHSTAHFNGSSSKKIIS